MSEKTQTKAQGPQGAGSTRATSGSAVQQTQATEIGRPNGMLQRAVVDPRALTPDVLLHLQGTIGNRAVQRLLDQRNKQASDVQRNAISQAPKNKEMPLIQRKLDWQNTNWDEARYLDASLEGSNGVLFVGEKGREIVVKPGDDLGIESAMAAMLTNDATQDANKGIDFRAPGVRVVNDKEAEQIKSALSPLQLQVGSKDKDLQAGEMRNKRAERLIGLIDGQKTIVQDLATGQTLVNKVKETQKHTEKKTFGGRKLRKESPLKVFTDRRSIEAMGMGTAVDLFTGNHDRLLAGNLGNFMVTPMSLNFIDNIFDKNGEGFFKDTQIKISDEETTTITAAQSLGYWMDDPRTKDFIDEKYTAITELVWSAIIKRAAESTREKDKGTFAATMEPYKDRFFKFFIHGLTLGKARLIESLEQLMKNQQRLNELVSGGKNEEMQQVFQSVAARKKILTKQDNNIDI